ncbi:MAG TPA: DUF87 domain-containing protein [Acidimicrobiales bacterium]|nr:DUF87 domain-containing protein [Acidimicrobiales bacterium]
MLTLDLGVYGPNLGSAAIDLARTTHGLVCGSTGSGKSFLARRLIEQAVASGMDVSVADPKAAGDYTGAADVVADGPEASVALLEHVARALPDRMTEPCDPLLMVVDELSAVQLRVVGETAKEAKDRVDRIHAALGSICLMGRSARIHLLAITQRADTTAIPGWARDQCSWRVAMGWMSPDGLRMMGFGDVAAPTAWPGHGWAVGIVGAPPGQPVPLHVTP